MCYPGSWKFCWLTASLGTASRSEVRFHAWGQTPYSRSSASKDWLKLECKGQTLLTQYWRALKGHSIVRTLHRIPLNYITTPVLPLLNLVYSPFLSQMLILNTSFNQASAHRLPSQGLFATSKQGTWNFIFYILHFVNCFFFLAKFSLIPEPNISMTDYNFTQLL